MQFVSLVSSSPKSFRTLHEKLTSSSTDCCIVCSSKLKRYTEVSVDYTRVTQGCKATLGLVKNEFVNCLTMHYYVNQIAHIPRAVIQCVQQGMEKDIFFPHGRACENSSNLWVQTSSVIWLAPRKHRDRCQ